MKEYKKPEMQIVEIGEDIITTSGCGPSASCQYESEGL